MTQPNNNNLVYGICQKYVMSNSLSDKEEGLKLLELGLYSSESQALEAIIQLMEHVAVCKAKRHLHEDFFSKIHQCQTFGELNETLRTHSGEIVKSLGEEMIFQIVHPKHVPLFGHFLGKILDFSWE